MRLIKFSLIALTIGLSCLLISYVAASQLEESKTYSYPQSLGRHYSKVSGRVFEGGIGPGNATEFRKSIPIDGSQIVDTVEIETTAIKVEVQPTDSAAIEIELASRRVNPTEPILIDSGRSKTIRIATQEENRSQSSGGGWLVFDFDDGSPPPPKRNTLLIRVPKTITNVQVRTISGDTKLATAVTSFHFQSKSGDMRIATNQNPLARVENLNIETVSGDLKGPGRFDRLKFNSVSGNIQLSSFDRVLDINAQSVSGDLEIETLELIDASVEFISKSGQAEIKPGFVSAPNGIKPNSIFKIGKGTAQVKFQTISGDFKLEKSDGDPDEDSDENDKDDHALLQPPHFSESTSRLQIASANLSDDPFLVCVAKIAVQENSKLKNANAKRCLRVVV